MLKEIKHGVINRSVVVYHFCKMHPEHWHVFLCIGCKFTALQAHQHVEVGLVVCRLISGEYANNLPREAGIHAHLVNFYRIFPYTRGYGGKKSVFFK